MTSNCAYLNQITNLRLFLKDNFYSRQEIINQITDAITNSFEVFSVNYEPYMQSIKIKIKITNMKKRYPYYEHSSMYYYEIMNQIILNTINSNKILLNQLYNQYKNKYGITESDFANITNTPYISGLYNITTLLDNIIIINL